MTNNPDALAKLIRDGLEPLRFRRGKRYPSPQEVEDALTNALHSQVLVIDSLTDEQCTEIGNVAVAELAGGVHSAFGDHFRAALHRTAEEQDG